MTTETSCNAVKTTLRKMLKPNLLKTAISLVDIIENHKKHIVTMQNAHEDDEQRFEEIQNAMMDLMIENDRITKQNERLRETLERNPMRLDDGQPPE